MLTFFTLNWTNFIVVQIQATYQPKFFIIEEQYIDFLIIFSL